MLGPSCHWTVLTVACGRHPLRGDFDAGTYAPSFLAEASLGIGGVGVTAAALPNLSLTRETGGQTSAALPAQPVRTAPLTDLTPTGPVVLHVRDAATGEIGLVFGDREHVYATRAWSHGSWRPRDERPTWRAEQMSSHREAPEISKDPVADSTDVYAFVSPDRSDTVTLIANYVPLQEPPGGPNFFEFGDDVLYQILVDNDGDARPEVTFQFRFQTQVRNPNTRGHDDQRTHSAVLKRNVNGRAVFAAVYPTLQVGEYRLWSSLPDVRKEVTILAASVSEVDWR
jgi:hypothetical protein